MPTETSLIDYYSRRAGEYERIYEKPERQEELRQLKDFVRAALTGHHVLEVACGTGYWTAVAAASVASILACDINDEEGNTYQARHLQNGSTFEVLKNYPTDQELRDGIGRGAGQIEIKRLQHYWRLSYQLEETVRKQSAFFR